MKRLPLILLMLLPVLARAQEVKPGLSKAYLDLIRKDSAQKSAMARDTTNSIRNSFYSNTTRYDGHSPIGKIKVSNKNFSIRPVVRKSLFVATTFNSSFELRPVNRQASLQNEFVQGRSQSGQLIWQGPETNELFSFGPSIHTLEFDNSNYAYDINGRLVPAGTGSGKKAMAYDNYILRTGSMLSHSLNMQAKYRINEIPRLVVGLQLSDKQERLPVKENKNSGQHLNASIALPLRTITIKGTYTTLRDRYTHPNRNGFLNRIYQQSLLTPVSFDNKQGTTLGAAQRSYSGFGDNPYFLLNTDENSYDQSNQTATLSFEKRIRSIKLELQHSIEDLHQRNNETYRPGTANFPAGAAVNRRKDDNNYQLKAGIEFNVPYSRGDLSSTVDLNYMYGNNRSAIRYQPGQQYHYQRSYHDMIFNYISMWTKSNFEGGLTLTNKLYASNSSNKKDFFLPGISLLGKFHEPFHLRDARVKIIGAFNNFNSELPISRSFSSNNLLQYNSYQSLQYFPVTEVRSFDRLDPIQHKEWNFRLEADYKYMIYLEADYYIRNTRNDVFAVYRSGGLVLENIADHRNQGYEIDLNFTSRLWNAKKVTTFTTIGLFRNKSTVTDVKNGYNGTPIAGFSNINKTVMKGQPLGAITGTRYKRDANNKLIIGGDGFPMVDATPAVIGNPIPDFVLKFGHNIAWKAFTLGCALEWKKGGEMWNGTQAVLDYYGRSANSAQLRNTSNYIFDGVLENGHVNNIPVDFYNPALPVENNRWTRYGYSGVGEEYIRKADYLRLNNLAISYRVKAKKILQQATFTLSASNIIIWTPYDGADPNQLLFDQQQTTGLDFFNLPSTKNFGFSVSLQF